MRTLFIDMERMVDAFRGDGGFAWGDHHPSMFKGVAEFFRPGYRTSLVAGLAPEPGRCTATAGGRCLRRRRRLRHGISSL